MTFVFPNKTQMQLESDPCHFGNHRGALCREGLSSLCPGRGAPARRGVAGRENCAGKGKHVEGAGCVWEGLPSSWQGENRGHRRESIRLELREGRMTDLTWRAKPTALKYKVKQVFIMTEQLR